MRITCPNCYTEYDVSDEKLAGRPVRCARCATEWTPVPEAMPESSVVAPSEIAASPMKPPAPPLESAPEPPSIIVPPREAPVVAASPQRSAAAAWVVSLVVIAGAITASYVWRADVMQAWPPSQRAYQALGLR